MISFQNIIDYYGFVLAMLFLFRLILAVGLLAKKERIKRFFFNLTAVIFALFLFEAYSIATKENSPVSNLSGTFSDNPYVTGKKDLLGYGPRNDTSLIVTSKKLVCDSVIYDVSYTLVNGRRLVPSNNDSADQKVYLLGGSFVFGDGLNDNQTLPFFISEKSERKINVVNCGFSGYGTHQALTLLEEITCEIDNTTPENNCIVYFFIPSHIDRAAGLADWDFYGPKYEIEKGQIIKQGTFNKKKESSYFFRRCKAIWQNSNLYNSVFKPRVKVKDIERVCMMVERMKYLATIRNYRFIVLIGDIDRESDNEAEFYNFLAHSGIEHYFEDDIITELRKSRKDFTINGDGHPNGKYNERLAAFIMGKLK